MRRSWLTLLIVFLLLCWTGKNFAQGENDSRSAVVVIRLNVDASSTDAFAEQVRNFAAKNSFKFRIAATVPDGTHFKMELWRDDIYVIALNPFERENFRVLFFRNSEKIISGPLDIQALANDFMIFIKNVSAIQVLE
jgi:hypothetical protein